MYKQAALQNNSSGKTGVVKVPTGYVARFEHAGKRHNIGWFKEKQKAVQARLEFLEQFNKDPLSALAQLNTQVARSNSKTKIRGVNPHIDGGFIVRVTVKGVRHYVGYFKTIEEAVAKRNQFVEEKTR